MKFNLDRPFSDETDKVPNGTMHLYSHTPGTERHDMPVIGVEGLLNYRPTRQTIRFVYWTLRQAGLPSHQARDLLVSLFYASVTSPNLAFKAGGPIERIRRIFQMLHPGAEVTTVVGTQSLGRFLVEGLGGVEPIADEQVDEVVDRLASGRTEDAAFMRFINDLNA